jgi:DNA-binding transcriptional LysR family regulator
MAFERLQRIAGFWDWLPGFRTVAEYESVQRGALALQISPSALSRTIRLLETAVGAALFTRSQTGVTLTPAGNELLAATRDAMRRVDDALARIEGSARRSIRAGATGPLALSLVTRALTELPIWSADARVSVIAIDEEDVVAALHRGAVDFVVGKAPVEAPDLEVEDAGLLRLSFASFDVTSAGALFVATSDVPLAPGATVHVVASLDAARELARSRGVPLVCCDALAHGLRMMGPYPHALPLVLAFRKPVTAEGTLVPAGLIEQLRALTA